MIRPYGPRTLANIGLVVARWGTNRRRLRDARRPLAAPGGRRRRARRADLGRAAPALQLPSPGTRRAPSVPEGDGSPSCCTTTAGSSMPRSPPPSSAPTSSTSTPPSPGRSWSTCWSARHTSMVVCTDEEFAGLLAGAHVESRLLAWTNGDGGARRPGRFERLRVGVRRGRPAAARPPRPHRDPRLRRHGTPKGAPRQEAGIDAAVSLLSRMPLRAGSRRWRLPLFRTLGLRAPGPGHAGLDGRAGPLVRSRRPRCAPRRRSAASRWS